MAEERQRIRLERLAAESRRLLVLIDELRELERQKHAERYGSGRYVELAELALVKSREIFELATRDHDESERRTGGEASLGRRSVSGSSSGVGDA